MSLTVLELFIDIIGAIFEHFTVLDYFNICWFFKSIKNIKCPSVVNGKENDDGNVT